MGNPLPLIEQGAPARDVPRVPLAHLDHLWFQVAGTLCNLSCRHCFISCTPHNRSFGFLGLETVRRVLDESVALGVKEYYFTGGEPFLNPDMTAILELTLQYGPATVLTNGTVFKTKWLQRLRRAEENSLFSLEFRVSLDGFRAEENDRVRGEGTFVRILQGVRQLLACGFLPLITVTQLRDDQEQADLVEGFVRLLKAQGYARPRFKIIPLLRIGSEVQRGRAYQTEEWVTSAMMENFDPNLLLCSYSRMVTDKGVYVCPILIDSPSARLGSDLSEAQTAYPLQHQACFTCYQYGSLCANPASGDRHA